MNDAELQEIVAAVRAKARAATPGPWRVEIHGDLTTWYIVDSDLKRIASVPFNEERPLRREAHAAFIAACDPTTVLALCDAVERLTAERDAAREMRKYATHRVGCDATRITAVPSEWPETDTWEESSLPCNCGLDAALAQLNTPAPPRPVTLAQDDVWRAVALIYRGARAQGATPDEAVQRCAEEAKGRGPIEDIVLRLADGRGARIVPPGAVVVDPEGEIPEAVIQACAQAYRDYRDDVYGRKPSPRLDGDHTAAIAAAGLRAALRAWRKGAA